MATRRKAAKKKAAKKKTKRKTAKTAKKKTAKKKTTKKISARAAGKTVDGYIAGLAAEQRAIAKSVRRVVKAAAPGAVESIKWGQPVWEANGPFAYMKAFGKTVNFGFWRGKELKDPKKLLQGSGGKMRHVKLATLKDVQSSALTSFVKQAVTLNKKLGDPSR